MTMHWPPSLKRFALHVVRRDGAFGPLIASFDTADELLAFRRNPSKRYGVFENGDAMPWWHFCRVYGPAD